MMPKLEPLIINPSIEGDKTVLTLGLARSGTSMLAAVIDALGCPMGDASDGHFERDQFKWDFNKLDHWQQTKEEITRLNNEHKTWGAKIRLDYVWLNRMIDQVRNPHIIIIFRDLAAILQRHISTKDKPVDEVMGWMIMQTGILWKFVGELRVPLMVVSCEKLRHTTGQIEPIKDFLGLDGNYLQASKRINKDGGYFGQ